VKSLFIRSIAGQHDLKGKRSKRMRCSCCVVVDLRPKFRAIDAAREMLNAKYGREEDCQFYPGSVPGLKDVM
jgi:hypothetical protein